MASPIEDTLTSMRTVNVRIYGAVQGVGFRASAQHRASELGLSGWIRNRRDDSVEVVASGVADDVGDLISWLHKGPAGARVARIDVTEIRPEGDFGSAFEIRDTA